MPNLYIERFGNGIPMVFLHGWGMPRSLLRGFAQEFATQHTIWLVDLPGYGQSDALARADDIQVLAKFLAEHLPTNESYILVGWSLGAVTALQLAAEFPQGIVKLVLFTATPCFMSSANWLHGVTQAALAQVAEELSGDYTKAMNRFLQLQLKNLPAARETIRQIKTLLAGEVAPDSTALQQGLEMLATTDLRQQLATITTPTLILNGDRDSLVPTLAARSLAEQMPHAQAVILHGAAHLPFMTHATACRRWLQEFLLC